MSTVVINAFTIPSLADAGLWGMIGTLFTNFWPAIVLCLGLMLFSGVVPGVISLVRRGAEALKSL